MRLYAPWIILGLILPPSGCSFQARSAASRTADNSSGDRTGSISILFVGNSHTAMHDVPDLVCRMIRFRNPEKRVDAQLIGVGFLEDVARNPQCTQVLKSRPWTHLVLQAQKESKSGQFKYSEAEGVEFAKLGKSRGAAVIFFSEWGVRNTPGHGKRIERIYKNMAVTADAKVAPVGRAWDLALSARPGLALYAADGNHETALGAFLTACVLYGRLTNQNPAALASFPYPGLKDSDRAFLTDVAAKALDSKP
jgi:hypothetical protein